MKREYYRNIGIKSFEFFKNETFYQDDDFIVIKNLGKFPHYGETIRLDCFIVAYCIKGETKIELNGQTYNWEKGCLAMILPSTFIKSIQSSEDFTVDIVVFSHSFLRHIFKFQKDFWDIAMYLNSNPIRNADQKKKLMFDLYSQLLNSKMSEEKNVYNREIIQHLFYAMFCEMLREINSWIPDTRKTQAYELKQSDFIFKKFIEKVAADDGSHRSVAYYADLLCYSPKYLSMVVKNTSGKSPLEIIHAHATELIKYKLRNSDKSIKEISNDFKFPNSSFFGKYVKTHLGMSPQQYRETQG
ncbi:MAG: helix-turn-helix transcriptional regulator [Bacteroides sp.]|nr:helix-turn-helix transcriptional regulator [Roseburia sp.]MCM1346109.1 helix-turn-helix transcriptional regulator [Bacteroides sp.]MCM1420744.1 helix-turn-helix transcriptional regulator [Bacteroides sp.]